MTREKVSISRRVAHLFTHHPWLKVISLILAVMVWLYVRGEINRFNY
ncbi:MAG TPA: hypothetical protein VMD04_00155 [Candidatus Margulisiibacteriota bacterium]|nr:hypothetical protein [Candidatus Margulisiibacteriota bacterium]